jgi:hypothetical protein
MLCKENYNILYSICSCLDSNVCRDCYELSNENNIEKCPVCRSELNFKLIYSNYTVNILFIINIVCGLLYYITLLTCPIYIIVNNTNNSNNNIDNNINNINNINNNNTFINDWFFLWMCIFNVVFLENNNIDFLNNYYQNNYLYIKSNLILYRILVLMYSLLTFTIMVNYDNLKLHYYLFCIFPVYIIPFIVINLIIYVKKWSIKYNFIKTSNSKRLIQILY